MFGNYLTIALRNLSRSKIYSLINISGLSLGIACCLLLALYVQDEFSYDRHHARLNDLYRLDTQFNSSQVGAFNKSGTVSPPITMTVKDELPEIEAATRVVGDFADEILIKYGDRTFYESNSYIADSTLFDVLTYDFTEGNPKKALVDANTVVLSQTIAKRLFGNQSALDKTILISQGSEFVNYKVTGVFRENKTFHQATMFTSMMSAGQGEYIRKSPEAADEWAGQNFVQSYLKIAPGHSMADVQKRINDVLVKYGSEDMKALGFSKTLFLEPVRDIYLKSQADRSQRITYIYIIVSIALFILVLACINFMNLSTAKASKRASEIGIRKVMGAFRSSLIRQILGEAMVIVLISILISVVLVQLALPIFNDLSEKNISFNSSNVVYIISALLVLTVVTGLIAGSYPAFYLSSFQPAQVLKGKFTLSNTSGRLRQGLVVFQFIVAIVLVCGMLVITRQLSFMKHKNLGFDSTSKILIPLRTGEAKKHYESLHSELQQLASITSVSGTEYPPGSPVFSDMAFYTAGGSMDNAVLIHRSSIDVGYMEMMGIPLVVGRNFTNNRKSEADGKLILNKTAAKKFGIDPAKLVGQPLFFDWQGTKYNFQVIGVMEDYNQTSLKDPIFPLLFQISGDPERYRYIVLSVGTSHMAETLASIENVWKKQISDTPFEYNFLDDNLEKQYNEDHRVSKIISSFTIIAMIICSLGLYGLSSFMAERRLKEIGVRKALGATVGQIVSMMSREFVRLVGIAFVISIPLALFAMDKWLQNFEYKIPMEIMVFVYAGLGAMGIALLTISYESFKAASADPVNTLRNE